MSEWYKFTEDAPRPDSKLWISDGETVWEDEAILWNKCPRNPSNNYTYYWMYRIIPEPPRTLHHCKGTNYECKEILVGKTYKLHICIPLEFSRIYNLLTYYCPECGFTVSEK